MSGLFECFHCGHRAVVWESDFTFEDYALEGEGTVHVCHCSHCGADIEYFCPAKLEEESVKENVQS
jgi:hypothetical protein